MNSSVGSLGTDARTASTATELAPPDHTYLHLDTDSSPMHWAMLFELAEGARLVLADVRERVRERSGLFDIFRLGVRNGRWRGPRPVLTEHIDIERHVTQLDYTESEGPQGHLATLLATPLPRPAPFWQITLLSPDRGSGRQYILLRVHHSLSDGIAGAAFAALLADGGPEDLSEFERFATSPRFRIPAIDPDVLETAKTAFDEQWKAGRAGRGWPALSRTGRREVAVYGISTTQLRRTARQHGATVHEFLLAAIGRTLSVAPPATGKPPAEVIRVTLPVTNDPAFRHTGNAVLVALLNLPGNDTDLARQIEWCRAELATLERTHPELALAATDHAPKLPWPLQRVIVNASMARMSPDIHIGINPGFSRVRSILGTPITELTPLSPLAGYSFSVTSLVLGHRTSFGVVTDPAAVSPGYAATFVEHFDRVLRDAARPE